MTKLEKKVSQVWWKEWAKSLIPSALGLEIYRAADKLAQGVEQMSYFLNFLDNKNSNSLGKRFSQLMCQSIIRATGFGAGLMLEVFTYGLPLTLAIYSAVGKNDSTYAAYSCLWPLIRTEPYRWIKKQNQHAQGVLDKGRKLMKEGKKELGDFTKGE